MEQNNKHFNKDEFDIVDFDLNEYNEELEKEAEKCRLKENRKAAKPKTEYTVKNTKQKEILPNNPNRDMLKTILMILFLIVVACLFLGIITFVVNHASAGSQSSKTKTEITTEQPDYTDSPSSSTSSDNQKKKLEDNIDEITNKVKNDSKTTNTTENKKKTTEATTQATESVTETKTEATTETTTEITTEATTEATTQPVTEETASSETVVTPNPTE